MKKKLMFALGLVILAAPLALAGQHARHLTGFFSTLRGSTSTGDLGGVEIFISKARVRDPMVRSLGEDRYYAYVQIAEGSPSEPQLVPAQLRGDTVRFTLVGKYAAISPFVGVVSSDSLIGRFSNDWQVRLPRRSSHWQ